MAFLQVNFHSQALRLACSMHVVLPQTAPGAAPRLRPVLWLLHGLSDDHTIWTRRTAVERHAQARGLAVVMPAVDRSFYQDMAAGNRYREFLHEELPEICHDLFPFSRERAENFVAGLSMGGYGAFYWALAQPWRFAAAASFSGALDLRRVFADWREASPAKLDELVRMFGPESAAVGGPADLFRLAADAAAAGVDLPYLSQWCGTEDFLYAGNVAFRDHARALGLPLDYAEGPGGHTWDLWDREVARFIAGLPLG